MANYTLINPDANPDDSKMDMDADMDSAVFNLVGGEQVRLNFYNIYIYRSSKQGKQTIVELGYPGNTETIALDIPFSDFDAMLQKSDEANDDDDYGC